MGVWSLPFGYRWCAPRTESAARPPAVTKPSNEGRNRDLSTIHRHGYRLATNWPETRTQARDRGLLGRPYQPIGTEVRRRDIAGRHGGKPGGRRTGLGSGEHLLLLSTKA